LAAQSVNSSFEVTAGLIPGVPMTNYTKQFHYLSEERDLDNHGNMGIHGERRNQHLKEAIDYYEGLVNSGLNWVRLDFIFY
jgi:hypothetical protein